MEYTVRSDGLQVASIRLRTPTVALALTVLAGSQQDAPQRSGLAHTVEHLAVGRSERHSRIPLAHAAEDLGGAVRATTFKENTQFVMHLPANSWRTGLQYLAQVLWPLPEGSQDLAGARAAVLTELRQVVPAGPTGMLQRIEHALWGEHPLSASPLGTPEGVRAVAATDCASFHAEHYRPARCLLTAGGPLTHANLLEMAATLLPPGDTTAPPSSVPRIPEQRAGQVLWLGGSGPLASVAIGVAGPGYRAPGRLHLALLNHILTVGGRGRLQRRLSQMLGQGSWMNGLACEYAAAGLCFAWARVPRSWLEPVTERILATLHELAQGGTEPDEFRRAQRAYQFQTAAGLESTRAAALWLANCLMRRGSLLSLAEATTEADAVTRASFDDAVSSLCATDNLLLCINAPPADWPALASLEPIALAD